MNCGRLLDDFTRSDRFLRYELQLKDRSSKEISDLSKTIASAEMQLQTISGRSTLTTRDYREYPYVSDESRVELRRTIFHELTTMVRPIEDDNIKLGYGGSLPRTECKKNRQAFYLIGLPASGKSSVACSLSDEYGAIILDSDFAKRKFPEYSVDFGASLVHDESSLIVFGRKTDFADEPNLLGFAVENGYNIVIPRIGNTRQDVVSLAKGLREVGYEIHLILVRLDRRNATIRALDRYISTNRYVPLSMIFDDFGNDPTITFYDLKQFSKDFKSFTMVSSDVPREAPKKLLIKTKHSPSMTL